MNHLLRFSLLVVCVCFAAAAFAQNAGSLDPTFGKEGIVLDSINGHTTSVAISVSVQSDGKIVAGGYVYGPVGIETDFALARYNSNGSRDTSFGIGGAVDSRFGGDVTTAILNSIAIKPNGKIVAAGLFETSSVYTPNLFVIVQYNANGSLDTTFGYLGIDTISFGTKNFGSANLVLVQPDGKIIAAGADSTNQVIVRLDSTGQLDSTFASNGVDSVKGIKIYGLALQPDGKILVSGYNKLSNGFALVLDRFTTNGSPDSTFGSEGEVSLMVPGFYSNAALSVAVQPNGKIITGGPSFSSQNYFSLFRFDSSGVLDPTFGTNGFALGDTTGNCSSLVLEPNGKIILAGNTFTSEEFLLERFNYTGSPDSTFGANGIVNTIVSATGEDLYSIARQPDGKIVAAGVASFGHFALARYLDSSIVTGVLNFSSLGNSILTYPNPVHNTETLDYTLTNTETLSINLYNVTGRVIRNYMTGETMLKGEHKQQLNFDNLAAGSYILTISNEEGKAESVRIVKH